MPQSGHPSFQFLFKIYARHGHRFGFVPHAAQGAIEG
jgi:hypothetical protein